MSSSLSKVIMLIFGLAAVAWFSFHAVFAEAEAEPEAEVEVITINDCKDLQNIANNLSGTYVLADNIDCMNMPMLRPMGPFIGTLDGATSTGGRYIISNVTIQTSDSNAGLFSTTSGATIKNIKLDKIKITGSGDYTGGLIGQATNKTTIMNIAASNIEVTGTKDTGAVGGLIGGLHASEIYDSHTMGGTVTGVRMVGGLIGHAQGQDSKNFAIVKHGWSQINVTGSKNSVGGLIGLADYTSVKDSYAGATFTNDFVTETGKVSGNSQVGGLIGYTRYGEVTNTYALGFVQGEYETGGLIGNNDSQKTTVINSYWGADSTGQSTKTIVVCEPRCVEEEDTYSGTLKTNLELQNSETFVDWNFDNIWKLDAQTGYPYPILQANP